MRNTKLTIALAASLLLGACSTNYGMYSKTDPKNDKFGYMSTYLAVAAGVIIAGAVSDDDSVYGGGGDSGGGGGGGGSGY